ncbi:hypothetical protein HZS_8184 [Henneguya salminicola]|nr:hypothetical protein HZS_8184 [Henneguya salminicola]
MNIENHIRCNIDYLSVIEYQSNGTYLYNEKFCGSQSHKTYLSFSNVLYVNFVSDKTVNIGGFQFRWNKEMTSKNQGVGSKLVSRLILSKITVCYEDDLIGLGVNGVLYFINHTTFEEKDLGIKVGNVNFLGYLNGIIILTNDEAKILKISLSPDIRIESNEVLQYGRFSGMETIDQFGILLLKNPNSTWLCIKDNKIKSLLNQKYENILIISCNMFGCYGMFSSQFVYFYIDRNCDITYEKNLSTDYLNGTIIPGKYDGLLYTNNCSLFYFKQIIIDPKLDKIDDLTAIESRCIKFLTVGQRYILSV